MYLPVGDIYPVNVPRQSKSRFSVDIYCLGRPLCEGQLDGTHPSRIAETGKQHRANFARGLENRTTDYRQRMICWNEPANLEIIIINQGTIVAAGTVAELRSRGGQGSLEDIFLSLTGGAEYAALAEVLA